MKVALNPVRRLTRTRMSVPAPRPALVSHSTSLLRQRQPHHLSSPQRSSFSDHHHHYPSLVRSINILSSSKMHSFSKMQNAKKGVLKTTHFFAAHKIGSISPQWRGFAREVKLGGWRDVLMEKYKVTGEKIPELENSKPQPKMRLIAGKDGKVTKRNPLDLKGKFDFTEKKKWYRAPWEKRHNQNDDNDGQILKRGAKSFESSQKDEFLDDVYGTKKKVKDHHRSILKLHKELDDNQDPISRQDSKIRRQFESQNEDDFGEDEEDDTILMPDEVLDANLSEDMRQLRERYIKKYGATTGQRIFRMKVLKNERGNWNPKKKLTRDEMNHLRELRKEDPAFYSIPVLSQKFGISPEAVERILHSKWEPTEQRREKQEANKFKKNVDVTVDKVMVELSTLEKAHKFLLENPWDLEMQKAIIRTGRNLVTHTTALHKKAIRVNQQKKKTD